MKNLFPFLTLLVIILCSCGSSIVPNTPDGCDEALITSINEEYLTLTTEYINDPTPANCEAYKEAIKKYLEAIDNCDDLYENQIENAQESLDDLEC